MMHVHLLARSRRFTYAATTRQRNLLLGFSRGSRLGGNSLSFSRALCRCDTRKQHVSRMNSHGGLARVLSFPLWLPGSRMYPPSRSPLSPAHRPPLPARSSLYLSPSRRVFLEHSKNHDGTRCRFLSPASPRVAPLLLPLLLLHVSPTSHLSRSPALFTRTLTRERAWKGAPGTKGIASGKPARVHVPGTRVSRKSAPRNREKGALTKRVLCNFDEMTYFYLRKV